jgi:hypothetical protein
MSTLAATSPSTAMHEFDALPADALLDVREVAALKGVAPGTSAGSTIGRRTGVTPMNERSVRELGIAIKTSATAIHEYLMDMREDDMPPALRQYLRRQLARINCELASVVEDTGAAGSKLARHVAQASPVPRPDHRCAKA